MVMMIMMMVIMIVTIVMVMTKFRDGRKSRELPVSHRTTQLSTDNLAEIGFKQVQAQHCSSHDCYNVA